MRADAACGVREDNAAGAQSVCEPDGICGARRGIALVSMHSALNDDEIDALQTSKYEPARVARDGRCRVPLDLARRYHHRAIHRTGQLPEPGSKHERGLRRNSEALSNGGRGAAQDRGIRHDTRHEDFRMR